jgi:hypothetical protein
MHPPTGRSICSSRALGAAVAAWLTLSPALAAAGDLSATELKSRADSAMEDGAFATAIESYRASYVLSHNPALLYNMGNAYERLGDYPNALAYLERFAAVAPAELKARVPVLNELVESLRAKLARVAVHCNVSGARVLLRGARQGVTPLASDIATTPGAARLEIVAEGYRPFAQEVELPAGKSTHIEAVLVQVLPAKHGPSREHADRSSSEPITSKWWFWTGLGVVLAGGATVAIVAMTREKAAPSGDIAPGQVAAPLVRW